MACSRDEVNTIMQLMSLALSEGVQLQELIVCAEEQDFLIIRR